MLLLAMPLPMIATNCSLFSPENIRLKVKIVGDPIDHTQSPMATFGVDDFFWPSVPIYTDRYAQAHKKITLIYQGMGSYQFNQQILTFQGKRCCDGRIQFLDKDNENTVFTHPFDYHETDVTFHAIKKRVRNPVYTYGGMIGNNLYGLPHFFSRSLSRATKPMLELPT